MRGVLISKSLGRSYLKYLGKILVLSVAYFITAKIGLSLDAVSGFAAFVWPPTGISLAAILLLGYRLWPGVFLGAFFANFSTGAPLPVAGGIAIGNMLEAVIGAYLIRRFSRGFHTSLDRLQDALVLIIFAAFFSTLVSATIGVSVLMLGGIVSAATYFDTWRAWWLGDVLANLTIAPFILIWARKINFGIKFVKLVEILGLALLVFEIYFLLFGGLSTGTRTNPISYLIFIPLVWSSVRFGVRGGVTTMFAIQLLALWGTINGTGPFIEGRLGENLLLLQLYIGTVSAVILVLSSSVSQHKNTEEEVKKLNKRLVENINEMKKLDKLKAEFMNIAAHELKTPLIPIIGYGEILLNVKGVPKNLKKKILIILESAKKEKQLVDNILDISRLEAGTMKFDIENVQMNDVVRNCVNEMFPKAYKKRIKISLVLDEKLPPIQGDVWRLSQVVENLLNNAIKFTDKGSVTVTTGRRGDNIVVSVKDTGTGIAKKSMQNLFTKFFQADMSAERRREGTGLGLIIVRKIIEAHNGRVMVKSKFRKGSTFSFILPIKNDDMVRYE